MPPTLYLMLGQPGAGKTTTAQVLRQLTGAEHLWADHARKEWFKKPTYQHQENMELYDHLNKQAEELLAAGKSVIYDTNFKFLADRQKLREVAAKHNAKTLIVWVQTPTEVAKRRATVDAHQQGSRLLGNMSAADFERLSNDLEEPRPDEAYVTVDGTKVSAKHLQDLLKN